MTTNTGARPIRVVALPVEIEAVRWTGDINDIPVEWRSTAMFHIDEIGLVVRTNKGVARVQLGEWIMHGTVGEYYPIPDAIYRYKYRPIDGADQ